MRACSSLVFAALASGVAALNATDACGVKGSSIGTQIVNGDDAQECAWKWQVGFLQYQSARKPFCGGSIVSDSWVFSAAHCTQSSATFYVIAGQWNVVQASGKEQVRRAVKVHNHPSYNSRTMSHDFVMVKVDQPFVFNDCVGKVCLPDAKVPAGTDCVISGWGTLKQGGNQPNILQEGTVKVISNSDCVTKYSYGSSDILPSMLCAQGKKGPLIVDACQGDSGGPLVCKSGGKYTLHGATSWGYGCAGPVYPGIWSRLSTVQQWTDSILDGSYKEPAPSCRRRSWCP